MANRKVHPIAQKLADLQAPMTFSRQDFAWTWTHRIMYTSAVVGYLIGFMLQSYRFTVYSILGAAACCCVLFLPNWWGNERDDSGVEWLPTATVDAYYTALESLEDADKKEK